MLKVALCNVDVAHRVPPSPLGYVASQIGPACLLRVEESVHGQNNAKLQTTVSWTDRASAEEERVPEHSLDLENRRALDNLIKEAWSPEGAAMAQANIPAVLDAMNLMANVHNKKASEVLRKRVEDLEKRLEDLDPEGAEKTGTDNIERPAGEEARLPVPPSIRYGPNRRRNEQRRLRPLEVHGHGDQALLQ